MLCTVGIGTACYTVVLPVYIDMYLDRRTVQHRDRVLGWEGSPQFWKGEGAGILVIYRHTMRRM